MNQILLRLFAAILPVVVGCVSKPQSELPQKPAREIRVATPVVTPSRPDPKEIIEQAAAKPSAPFEGEGWKPMFDGKSLAGWRVTEFAGGGEVSCQLGAIMLGMGSPFTGINWTNESPKMNYEVAFDAMRANGSDFFCALTFPVGDAFCSLILGGWGGGVVGLSSIDGQDASENETTQYVQFENGRWYRVRLRVTEAKIEAWIDERKIADVATEGRRISLRPGDIERSKPFGVASWQTTGALREMKMRQLVFPIKTGR